MVEVYEIDGQIICEKALNDAVQDVLNLMKKEKRTYLMNKTILKHAIGKLEQEQNSIIFQ